MADVGHAVYNYFTQRGYSPAAAAGIVGNFQQESSLNPNDAGGGLDQGQGARFHPGNLQQQLNGIYGELRGPEASTAAALKGAKSPREAALIFSKRFERPGEPLNNKREQYAEEALARYGGTEAGHASAAHAIASEIAPHIEPQAGPNSAQTADIVSALTSALGSRSSGPAISAPQRPQSAGGAEQAAGTPRVPQAAQEAPKSADPSTLLGIVSKLAAEASPTQEATPAAQAAPESAKLGTRAPTGSAAALTSRKGIVPFDGKRVAAWIAPILQYVESKGVKPQITSGYRSKAEQERIYNSGVRPAAVPGTSNHEGDEFPRGAVDISNAAEVAKVLADSPYKGLLVYAGSKDDVHFSHPHDGSY